MIILLGLPKCGTMSFTQSFKEAGFNPVHWMTSDNEYVAELILLAIKEHKPLLSYLVGYDVFTQMDLIQPERGIMFFPQVGWYWNLYLQYPNAKFILNTRSLENHAESIAHWGDLKQRFEYFGITDLRRFISEHNKRIINFFKVYGDKSNFVEFDIERDSDDKLSAFIGREIKMCHINKRTK